MSGPLGRRTIRSRVWAGARLRFTATLAALVMLLAFGVRADLPDLVPASVSCDSVGYAYDAAGQLAGVRDQAGRTARYGYDPAGNITSVTDDGSPALALLSVVPARAAVGAEVTLQGGCFSDVPAENTVEFNGVPAPVTAASGHRLVTRVPAGATTGLITVQVGGATATSPQSFVVAGPDESAPTVTGVSPTVVVPGGTVTVTGTGFAPAAADNAVTLNRTRAATTAVAAGSLTLQVPSGAASGRIGVRTRYGSGDSAADVFVAPAPYTVADVVHTSRVALGEAKSVTIPSAGDVALVVFDLAEGQQASVQLADGTFGSCGISTAKVLDPFGRTAASSGCVGATGFIDTVRARTAGTYTLLLAAASAATGSVTATVREVPADASAGTTPGGDPVTVTTAVAGQNAAVTFPGSTGQRVSVEFTGGTYGTYNATVSLRRPGGGTIVSNTSCGASCFFDATVLPADGTYTVYVDPESTYTGTITVKVNDVPADATAGTTPGGAAQTVTTTVPGQNAAVSFPATAGQRVSLQMTGGTYGTYNATVSLRRPDGTSITSNGSCGASCFFDATVLPTDGTYIVVVDPEGTAVGALTVKVNDVPADATASTTVGGTAASVATTVPGQNAVVSFPATAGQRVSLQMTGGTYGTYDATVSLRRPDGTSITSNGSCGASCFFDATVLPVDGTYAVVVDPEGTVVGGLTVQVNAVPADDSVATTAGGAAVTVSTTVPGQNAAVTFPGVTDQRISVELTGGTYGTYNATVSLRKPDGATIVSNGSCGASCYFDATLLPADGTYTVVVDPEGTVVGGLTVKVNAVPADDTAATTPDGAAVTVTTTVPGQNAAVTFPGFAGQVVTVTMANGTFGSSNAWVGVRGPDGTYLVSNSSCGTGCSFPSLSLPADGTYAIVVDPKTTTVGAISAQVYDVPADAVANTTPGGDAVTVTTTVPGQNAVVSFPAAEGQRVSVEVTAGTFGSSNAVVTLRRPDGTTIVSNSSCGTSCYFDATTLPAAGTYTVLVDPKTTVTGAITVKVNDVPADATATTAPGGAAPTVTTTVPGQNAVVSFPAAEGQRVSVEVTAGTFGSSNATVSLRRPDGTTIVSNSSCGTSCYFDATTLAAGDHVVVVDPKGTALGAITVKVNDVPADATASTTPDGAAVAVTTTVPGQNAVVSFPGAAGQVVTVNLTGGTFGSSNATVTLRKPDGATVVSNSSCGTSCNFSSVTLPDAGTWTVLVDPKGTAVGTITAQVYDVPVDVAASTTPGGPAVTVATTVPGQNAVVSFPATDGQRVSVELSGGTYGSSNAVVTLRRPDGTAIVSNSSCGTSCFFDATVLAAAGTYSVYVDPKTTVTGGITVKVNDVPADAAASTTPGGAAQTVTTTVPGQNAAVSFPATAGQRVSVQLTGGTYGTYNATVSLRRPDGTSITSNGSCGASCFFDVTDLPVAGTYTVLVDPEVAVVGALTVKVNDVPADATASTTPGGAAVTVTTTVPGQNGVVSFP
ncbi:beta strand repeat-containing protein, partial [Micromonospora sp. NPDC048930]|uniref:beta strand repeat-containing protein n=1 Tax=Micromonospora sp. NPDC048930 TaxID=3364261 RepID=UPI00371D2C1D